MSDSSESSSDSEVDNKEQEKMKKAKAEGKQVVGDQKATPQMKKDQHQSESSSSSDSSDSESDGGASKEKEKANALGKNKKEEAKGDKINPSTIQTKSKQLEPEIGGKEIPSKKKNDDGKDLCDVLCFIFYRVLQVFIRVRL